MQESKWADLLLIGDLVLLLLLEQILLVDDFKSQCVIGSFQPRQKHLR